MSNLYITAIYTENAMLEAGQTLNQRYQLTRKLGQNGGRQTWQAEDTLVFPHELVIVKLLGFAPQLKWDDLKLFEREANVLKQLNHSRIPKYRDYFSINDCVLWFGLVHNYVPGISLKERLINGQKFSETEVWNIATSILEILIYLHELSPTVLHRDIKPSNIIIEQDGTVHLVDFGAVQARAAIENTTFTVVGTYGYTPIEQFGGRAVPASDLYALGATLIHLLTGISPSELPQQNMQICFRRYVSIPPHLTNWIESLTETDVERRFQTARQALAALNTPFQVQKTALLVQQPYNSRIQLKRSPDRLEIKILGQGIQANDGFLFGLVLIFYGSTFPFSIIAFPFVILFWLFGLIPVSILMYRAFAQISLRLDRDYFTIKWKLLGLRYRLIKGRTSIIQNVCEDTDNFTQVDGTLITNIALQFENQKHQFCGFTAPITANERQWLIQELKDWLQII